jgi:DNA-binding response OmpR family regulator
MVLGHGFFRDWRQPSRVLIIEDELQDVEWLDGRVREFGYAVSGAAGTFWESRTALANWNFDAVLLDIDVDEQQSYQIADLLLDRKIPFAFLIGDKKSFEARHASIPLLKKPYTRAELRPMLKALLGPPGGTAAKTANAG